MEKLYMKFKEEREDWSVINPNSPSLEECVAVAERMGYKQRGFSSCMKLRWRGILYMWFDWDYLVIDNLGNKGYKEHKITTEPTYRKVYVSDESVEEALKRKEERIFLAEIVWNDYKYICVNEYYGKEFKNNKDYYVQSHKFISEIPTESTKETIELNGYKLDVDKLKELWIIN